MKLLSYYLAASSIAVNLIALDAPEKPLPYFVDCRSVMVDLYGDLLFLQPNGSSLYYGAEAIGLDESISIPAISPNWNIQELRPNYSAAFKVGAKLLFSEMNTNLEASWQHFYSSKQASHATDLTGEMMGPISDIGPNSAVYGRGDGKVRFHFDAVNLVFGQQFCAFKNLYPNVYAGAGFARIKQKMSSTFINPSAITSRTIESYSTFTGAGPQVGFDFNYRIICDFFFTGTTSIGLIIGESENGTTYLSNSPYLVSNGIPEPNTQAVSVPNRTQLVPSLEERIGFSYAGIFKCCKVEFGAGYLAQIYLNAIQSIDMTAPQVEPSLFLETIPDAGVFAVGFERTLSNFILTGPYISLSVIF